jgi:hypothetical protein
LFVGLGIQTCLYYRLPRRYRPNWKVLKAQAMPGEFESVATQARKLREWFRGFVKARSGRRLGAHDLLVLEPLNHLLDRDERFDPIVVEAEGGASALRLKQGESGRPTQPADGGPVNQSSDAGLRAPE